MESYKNNKIGVLIPTRGDRKKFLIHATKMIYNQTMQPHDVCIIDFKPTSDDCDITLRYKIGIEKLKDCDLILFWEDDDYYKPNYIETMSKNWKGEDIIGINHTTYYHLSGKIKRMEHNERSSMFCTGIRSDLKINFPADNEPFLDMHLWKNYKGKLIDDNICMGIKHGIGKCGGKGHQLGMYKDNDNNYEFLKSFVDSESYLFYMALIKSCISTQRSFSK